MYELILLGRHPFEGETTTELVRGIMNEEPPEPPATYSNDLISAAKALLNKDPSARMTIPQFLSSPAMASKVASTPANYKPKHHMEERFRRAQVKQLTRQIENLGITPKTAASTHGTHGAMAHGNSSTQLQGMSVQI